MCDELVLNELQLLAAMYDTDDVRFNDSEIAQLVENGIPVNDSVSLSVRLNDKVVLDVRLPLGYPKMERLSAYCRLSEKSPTGMVSSEKVRAWENKFNQMLTQNYLSTQGIDGNSGDELPSVLGVIQWCNDSFPEYPVPTEDAVASEDFPTTSCSCRIWIFSHHIYNKNKRKFLIDTAGELNLNGFSHPGKPGFICVEGDPSNCDEYWSRVRQLTWQKISLIERQIIAESDKIFNKFEELPCDKSQFIKFLDEKQSSQVIKEYLGI